MRLARCSTMARGIQVRQVESLLLAIVVALLAVGDYPPPSAGEIPRRPVITAQAKSTTPPVTPTRAAASTVVPSSPEGSATAPEGSLEGHSGLKTADAVLQSAAKLASAAEPVMPVPDGSSLGRRRPAAAAQRVAVELPKRVRIPSIGVEAGFEYVGRTADGAMDIPKNPNDVAWYSLGPRPGEPGNAVIAGHVDWGGKTAVFWKLDDLKAGDVVQVVAVDGRVYEFVVQWQRLYDAETAPVSEVFAQSDATEITLITCGGVFDRQTRQYLSRLVVRAVLR